MDFCLAEGEKFACIAFNNIALSEKLPQSVDLGGDTWVLQTSPADIDKQWREWLGSIRSKQIAESIFFIVAKRVSKHPSVLDDENRELQREVDRLFYGLLLQGIPEYEAAFTITGASLEGKHWIRQFGRLDTYYRTEGSSRYRIGIVQCRTARMAADGLKLIYDSKDYQRLKRGLRALVRGIREKYPEDRLHEFVRSVEALIKPEMLKTKRQFIHRSQTLCLPGASAAQLLGECYEIRNKVEHMHPFEEALSGYPADKVEAVGLQRLRQIEALALTVYLKVSTSGSHADIFRTDSSIDAFWRKNDHENGEIALKLRRFSSHWKQVCWIDSPVYAVVGSCARNTLSLTYPSLRTRFRGLMSMRRSAACSSTSLSSSFVLPCPTKTPARLSRK